MTQAIIPSGSIAVKKRATISNARGLHARAAAKFVKTAEQFSCDIQVKKGDLSACGKSMLDLLMLAATPGSEVEISCQGADAENASQTLCLLIQNKFDEE